MRWILVASCLAGFWGGGCKKSAKEENPTGTPAKPNQPLAVGDGITRIHWLGKKRIAADTNSTFLMTVWNLPESEKLEAQTLDKLSVAPWRGLTGTNNTPGNGSAAALLRPLLADLLHEEFFLELRGGSNQPGELALAVHLTDQQSGLWETNLPAVLVSLGAAQPIPQAATHGWQMIGTNQILAIGNCAQRSRAGDWTILGLGSESNTLFGAMLARTQRDLAPHLPAGTNFWLKADIDSAHLAKAFGNASFAKAGVPQISISFIGSGDKVRTRGQFNFPQDLPIRLEPWNIPTNAINDPLVGFTAIRGIEQWLGASKLWQNLALGSAPNQVFFWGMEGPPLYNHWAAPLPDADQRVKGLVDHLVNDVNPNIAIKHVGKFEPLRETNGVVLAEYPFLAPYTHSARLSGVDFIIGGLSQHGVTNRPVPIELIQAVLSRTNLVCYDWELTESRLQAFLYVGQILRFMTGHAQLPPSSAGLQWVKALTPKLGNCATAVTLTGPRQLSFARESAAGFSGLELHLLADWFESPQFPIGLHTFLAPPDARPVPRQRTNSNAAAQGAVVTPTNPPSAK